MSEVNAAGNGVSSGWDAIPQPAGTRTHCHIPAGLQHGAGSAPPVHFAQAAPRTAFCHQCQCHLSSPSLNLPATGGEQGSLLWVQQDVMADSASRFNAAIQPNPALPAFSNTVNTVCCCLSLEIQKSYMRGAVLSANKSGPDRTDLTCSHSREPHRAGSQPSLHPPAISW